MGEEHYGCPIHDLALSMLAALCFLNGTVGYGKKKVPPGGVGGVVTD